jgi:hypothetical protein
MASLRTPGPLGINSYDDTNDDSTLAPIAPIQVGPIGVDVTPLIT